MSRKIFLSLNYAASASVEDINGNTIRLRHGDGPVEISEKLYNEYKNQSSNIVLPISDKRLDVVIHKYIFTFIEQESEND
jgi:hypothetical protein